MPFLNFDRFAPMIYPLDIEGVYYWQIEQANELRFDFMANMIELYKKRPGEGLSVQSFKSALVSVLSFPEFCDAKFWTDRSSFGKLDSSQVIPAIDEAMEFILPHCLIDSATAFSEIHGDPEREATILRFRLSKALHPLIHRARCCAWYGMISQNQLIQFEDDMVEKLNRNDASWWIERKDTIIPKETEIWEEHLWFLIEDFLFERDDDGRFPYDLIIYDLDTLVQPKDGKKFRSSVNDWEWIGDRKEIALYCGREFDMQSIVVTCQGGVAFGIFTEEEMNQHLLSVSETIEASFYACYTHPRSKSKDPNRQVLPQYLIENDPRRKPNPGLVLEAMHWHEVKDATKVLVVGKRHEDQQMAKNAGTVFCFDDVFFSIARRLI